MINEQVPGMRHKLERLVRETNNDLEDLGTSVEQEESNEALSKIIQAYSSAVQNNVNTTKNNKGFWQETKKIFSTTARSLRKAAPTFEVGGKAVSEAIIDVQEDWSLAHSVDLPFTKAQQKSGHSVSIPPFDAEDVTWLLTLKLSQQIFPQKTAPRLCLKVLEVDDKIQAVDVEFKVIAAGNESSLSHAKLYDAHIGKGESFECDSIPNVKDDDLRLRIYIRVKVSHDILSLYNCTARVRNIYILCDSCDS